MNPSLMILFLIFIIEISQSAKLGRADLHRSTLDRTLESVVPKNYDSLERPSMKGAATVIHVSVHLSHIEWQYGRLTVAMYLRQKWIDPRLRRRKPSSVVCKPPDLQQYIWFPDTYLANLIEETRVLNPGYVRVSSDGEIAYSTMLKSTLSCPTHSPAKRLLTNDGIIDCEIALESYSYSADEVNLKWSTNTAAASIDDTYNDMIKSIATGEMIMRLTSRGSYSRLSVNLTLDTGLNGEKLDFAMRRLYGKA